MAQRQRSLRRIRALSTIHGEQFKDVTVRVVKVHAAPATAMIDLPIVRRMRFASVWNTFLANASEDRVEFLFTDLERIVMDIELINVVIEIQREGFIHPYRREIPDCACVEEQSKRRRKELRRLNFVPRRHDGVIEFDRHERSRCIT